MRTIPTTAELGKEAKAFLAEISPRVDGATLITLSGELGAGKTAFVKECAFLLGVGGEITSPTFVLEKIYALSEQCVFRHLVHIDAYRLKDASELSALGFDELMKDPGNLVMLEWPERVTSALPTPTAAILLAVNADGTRILDVVYP